MANSYITKYDVSNPIYTASDKAGTNYKRKIQGSPLASLMIHSLLIAI